MKGYKGAIWDRIPDHWRKAAEHCRCKQRLIDNIYIDMMNCVKLKCTTEKRWGKDYVRSIKNTYLDSFKNVNSPFCWAFKWQETKEGVEYWQSVNSWVNYFKDYMR